ncbi:uncharacterized protein LOC129753190 [Uranotaenia lowii]|uniref:uncharacterized protein LOC129753190 n=1 Tax=Uranotaenia lowii TaxID=190385 RepID=UPI00247B177B|nr:uncharacterized protein LOC129753190 [Uranotaenia lowii]
MDPMNEFLSDGNDSPGLPERSPMSPANTVEMSLVKPVDSPGSPGKCFYSICPAEALTTEATRQLNEPILQKISCASSYDLIAPDNHPALSVYYQNVRGLRTKIDDFYLSAREADYDVIVLTETWLNDEIFSQQLFGDVYDVYRNDRDALTTGKRRGGGVLIAVANRWNSLQVSIHTDLEMLWAKIITSSCDVFFGVVYMSPDTAGVQSVMESYMDLASEIRDKIRYRDYCLLFGDFNQPNLNWVPHSNGDSYPDLGTSSLSASSSLMIDRMAMMNLKQINSAKNSNNRTLDLLFVNDAASHHCVVGSAPEALTPIDAHHPVITVDLTFDLAIEFCDPTLEQSLNLKKIDFAALNAALRDINWQCIDQTESLDEAVSIFTTKINQLLALTTPPQHAKRKPPWSNRTLATLKRTRAAALRYYSLHKNAYSKSAFIKASKFEAKPETILVVCEREKKGNRFAHKNALE